MTFYDVFSRLVVPCSVAITAIVCAEEDRHTPPSHQEEDLIPPNINALRVKGLGGTDRLISLSTTDSGFLVDPIFPPYDKDSIFAGVADDEEDDLYEEIMKKLLDARRMRSQKADKATEEQHSSTRTSSASKDDPSEGDTAEPAESLEETVDGKIDVALEDNILLSPSMDCDMAGAQETRTDTEEENVGEDVEREGTVPTKLTSQNVASTAYLETSQKEGSEEDASDKLYIDDVGNEEDASDELNMDDVADKAIDKNGNEKTETDFRRPEDASEREHVSFLSDDAPATNVMVDTVDEDQAPVTPKRGEDESVNESGDSPASVDDSVDSTGSLRSADATSGDRVDGHAGSPEKEAHDLETPAFATQSCLENGPMHEVDSVVAVDELVQSARDSADEEPKEESSDNSVNSKKYQQDLNVDTDDEHIKIQRERSITPLQGIRSANNSLSESNDSDKCIAYDDTDDVSPDQLSNDPSNPSSIEERNADTKTIASKGEIGDIHENARPGVFSLDCDNAGNGETVDHDMVTSNQPKEHDDFYDLSSRSPLHFVQNDDLGQRTVEKAAQETIGTNPVDECVETNGRCEAQSAEGLIGRAASNQKEQLNMDENHDTCGNEAFSAEGDPVDGISKFDSKPSRETLVVDAEEEDATATSELPSGTSQSLRFSPAGSELESHDVRSERFADSEPQLDGMIQLPSESGSNNGTEASSLILDKATDEESPVGDDVGTHGEHVHGNITFESTTSEPLPTDTVLPPTTASGKPKKNAANEAFLSGFDDFDKLLEQVDPPDELDVAQGSSIQEVLVQKGTQILTKHVVGGVKRVGQAVRKAASKAKRKFPKVFASKHGLIAIKEKALAHNIGKYAQNFRRIVKRACDNIFGGDDDDDDDDFRRFKSNIVKGSFNDKRENADEPPVDMEDIQKRIETQRQLFQERTKGKTGQELAAEFAKLKAKEREENLTPGLATEKEL